MVNVAVVGVIAVPDAHAAPTVATAPATVVAQADWILAAQMPDGAIAHWTDHKAVWPYLSNFAAMGLARASVATGDARYVDGAWRWLAWYGAHQDASGFVTDYTIVDGVPVSTGTMDSTDAYAGTFLIAARDAWRTTLDRERLRPLQGALHKAVDAVVATQDTDGLTWAKPTWKVKYLMDQVEAAAGLTAAEELALVLGDTTLGARAKSVGDRLRAGIESLWNPATGTYAWAVHESGQRQSADMSVLYPDAMQQAWTVAFGIAPPDRSVALLDRFATLHPQWAQPAAIDRYDSGPRPVGYWAPVGWAFTRVGDLLSASAGATSIETAAVAAGRAWPFTPSDAGQLLVLETATVLDLPGSPVVPPGGSGTGGGSGPPPPTTSTTVPGATTTTVAPSTTSTTVAPTTTTTTKPTKTRLGTTTKRRVSSSSVLPAGLPLGLPLAGLLVPVAAGPVRRRLRGSTPRT